MKSQELAQHLIAQRELFEITVGNLETRLYELHYDFKNMNIYDIDYHRIAKYLENYKNIRSELDAIYRMKAIIDYDIEAFEVDV